MENNENQTPPAELLAWWDESSNKQSSPPEENYKISTWDKMVAKWREASYEADKKTKMVVPPPKIAPPVPVMVTPVPVMVVPQPQVAQEPLPEWLAGIFGIIFIGLFGFLIFSVSSLVYRLSVLFG